MLKPEIDAELTLLIPSQGGKVQSISGEYRGVFQQADGKSYSMRFCLPAGQLFEPGQTLTVPVQFLDSTIALSSFPVGAAFVVWEGRAVGHERVVKVHQPLAM